jgi:hypothetical protein
MRRASLEEQGVARREMMLPGAVLIDDLAFQHVEEFYTWMLEERKHLGGVVELDHIRRDRHVSSDALPQELILMGDL